MAAGSETGVQSPAFQPTVNPDLQKERDHSTFDRNELTTLLCGGAERLKRKREIEDLLISESLIRADYKQLPRDEEYEQGFTRGVKVAQLAHQRNWSADDIKIAQRLTNYEMSNNVHFQMFIPALEGLGTDEQKAKWLPVARSLKIIGTYAQTELGHGTNLQALETLATFDEETDEFILHTPTLTARKWWPGGLGKSSNHALVLAQLRIKGKNYGMHPFMVQIRSLKDHQPLPGVMVGDIGEKMAGNYSDNGYLSLDHVRVPRTNMLMRYSQVSREGTYSRSTNDRANYGTMIYVRTEICDWAYNGLCYALTVGVRYSAVRRQGQIEERGGECQIMDYQTQQYKLFPYLAGAYALYFAKNTMKEQYLEFSEQIKGGSLSGLQMMHSQSAGMKAFSSDLAVEGTLELLRACGGHGYLNASGLPKMMDSYIPLTIVEGENTVLYLQVARFLVKQYTNAFQGKTVHEIVGYMNENWSVYACQICQGQDCHDTKALLNMYQCRAQHFVARAAMKLQSDMGSGLGQFKAWNNCLIDLVTAAKAHTHYYTAWNFNESLSKLSVSPALKRVLDRLCLFYTLHGIVKHSGEFLESGALSPNQLSMLRVEEQALLPEIRPDAVSLVDAFDVLDLSLNSALGCQDGWVYEKLVESAKYSALNTSEVLPAHRKYLQGLQPHAKL